MSSLCTHGIGWPCFGTTVRVSTAKKHVCITNCMLTAGKQLHCLPPRGSVCVWGGQGGLVVVCSRPSPSPRYNGLEVQYPQSTCWCVLQQDAPNPSLLLMHMYFQHKFRMKICIHSELKSKYQIVCIGVFLTPSSLFIKKASFQTWILSQLRQKHHCI